MNRNPITQLPNDVIVFDTETTGFHFENGDRLVEIGAVKMRNGLPTNESFHAYINPNRDVPKAAQNVHGLTTEFLKDKPQLEEVLPDFLKFVGNLPLAAHNAKFDKRFINMSLDMIGLDMIEEDRFFDTIPIARRLYPGSPANLDALCRRHKISLDSRNKHGALIDSELLALVILEMGGGRQKGLFERQDGQQHVKTVVETVHKTEEVLKIAPIVLTEDEMKAHDAFVTSTLGENPIWKQLEAKTA